MDKNRLRWITSPPTLDRWEMGVRYAATPQGTLGTVTCTGHCDRKRGALWIVSDTYLVGADLYGLADYVHHLALVLEQARPITEQAVERALVGEYWEQQELPF